MTLFTSCFCWIRSLPPIALLFSIALLIYSCSPNETRNQDQVDQSVDSMEYVINNFKEIRITVSKDGAVTVDDGSVNICEVGELIASQIDDPSKFYVRLVANAETSGYHVYCIDEQLRDIGLYKQVYQIEGKSEQILIRLPSYNDYDQIPIRALEEGRVRFLNDTIPPDEVELRLKTELDNNKKLWVRFSGDRSSSYEMYLAVYNKTKELVSDRYEEVSQNHFGKPYAELDSLQLKELSNVLELMVSESACLCE